MLARGVVLGMLAACAAGGSPRERVVPAGDFGTVEREVARLVNEHRVGRRLPRLSYDTALATIARAHSSAMATRRVPLGHDEFARRAAAAGRIVRLEAVAENVALNNYDVARTASVALRGWVRSTHHRENIEGAFDVTGVGVVRAGDGTFFFTQLFVARRR